MADTVAVINHKVHLIREIRTDEIRIGMQVYFIERYASGAELTFYGHICRVGRDANGERFADLRGIPHQGVNGRQPESVTLYEVLEVGY